MNHRELRSTLRAIASGDVGAMPSLTIKRVDGEWVGRTGQQWSTAATLQELLGSLVVGYFADVAVKVWLERWEPLIRAGVAIMCSVGAARLADMLGVSVEDVRGGEL